MSDLALMIRIRPPLLLRGSNDCHWTKVSSIWAAGELGGQEDSKSFYSLKRIERGRGVHDDGDTDFITRAACAGVDGQLKESNPKPNFNPPLGATILVLYMYAFLALSFVSPQLLGPFAIMYTGQKFIQKCAYLILFFHVLEAIYAVYLSSKVDPDNVLRWAALTAFYGLLALEHLHAKTSVRKLDSTGLSRVSI
ncbi:hypothetical protein R1sor_004497 [Riccia sorocarpa]|uniref:Uncharacterized protein n=1 Tax=Riccia sorocarpa TaxID=122646 RepID=A0ABD3HJ40_9MARC